jgi:hypothetical protein
MEEYEEKICWFKKYMKQSMDLMVDAFKWKMMAEYSEDEEMKMKYMQVSDTLYNMYMVEYDNIGKIFRGEEKKNFN